ncbi:MAG: hypothetical protein ABEN55_15675 [Bradymonadaceae bacterium]
MTSEEEKKYFETKESEWREDVRREKRLEAIRKQEKEGIAEALRTSDDVAEEALELGFDQDTARVLPLVPLIQMAWADGNVSSAESRTVRELAKRFGLEPDSEAFDFLRLMLSEQPSDLFFERVNRVVRHLITSDTQTWDQDSLVDLVEEVARASGGFFGLTNPINSDERDLLQEFAEEFEVQEKGTDEVLGSQE